MITEAQYYTNNEILQITENRMVVPYLYYDFRQTRDSKKKKRYPKKKVARFRSKSVQSINRNGFEVIWDLTAHHIVKTHNPLELFSQPALDGRQTSLYPR